MNPYLVIGVGGLLAYLLGSKKTEAKTEPVLEFTPEEAEQAMDDEVNPRLWASETALKKELDNTPEGETLDNLRFLQEKISNLETKVGPVVITSGYRSQALNKLVGGESDSRHLQGLAIDIGAEEPKKSEIFNAAQTIAGLQQVIRYDWQDSVHLAFFGPEETVKKPSVLISPAKGQYQNWDGAVA